MEWAKGGKLELGEVAQCCQGLGRGMTSQKIPGDSNLALAFTFTLPPQQRPEGEGGQKPRGYLGGQESTTD